MSDPAFTAELSRRMNEHAVAVSDLATALGVSRTTVQRWLNGISAPHVLMQRTVWRVLDRRARLLICQDCFRAGPLYYADRTNDRYMCRPCWDELGKEPRPMTDQTTIDIAAARGAATAAQKEVDTLGMLLAVRVTSDAEAQWAVDATRSLRDQRRALESERDAQVKPLNAVVKRIRDFFRKPIDALTDIETHLKGEVKRFRDVQAEAQAAALQSATTAAEVADAVAVLAPRPDGIIERAVWSFVIEDLAQVPREYFVLDEARIAREVRAGKDKCVIPGIRVVRDTQVVVR